MMPPTIRKASIKTITPTKIEMITVLVFDCLLPPRGEVLGFRRLIGNINLLFAALFVLGHKSHSFHMLSNRNVGLGFVGNPLVICMYGVGMYHRTLSTRSYGIREGIQHCLAPVRFRKPAHLVDIGIVPV